MAEGWANHFGKGKVEAHSAGSHPLGKITAETYTVMSERGISIDSQWSKGLTEILMPEMDVVVSMGCEVECPIPDDFKGRVAKWEIPDPYGQGIETFRNVRDMVERQVLELLANYLPPGFAS